MKFDKIEYLNGEMPELPQTLTIDANGLARYESHTNEFTPDHPEIGIYEMTLPAAEVQALGSLLNDPPFKELPDHWGRVLSGDHYKRIRVMQGAEAVEKLVGTREPIDPRLRRLLARLEEIVGKVKNHPRQTLRIELTQATMSARGEFTAMLSLSSGSTQAIHCRHPAELLNAADGWLSIQMWLDKPPANLRPEDLVTAKVDKVEDLRPLSARQPDASVIEIPAKGAVSFRLRAAPPLKRVGVYAVRVSYATFAQQIKGRTPIAGELFSKTIKVNVTAISRMGR